MVKGRLQPSLEEELAKHGKGIIHVGLFLLQEGRIGKENEKAEFSVEANPSDIIVRLKGRVILFSIEDLVRDSDELIEGEQKEKQ